MADSSEPLTFGYWAIRGLAQPIRMALILGDVEFNDVRYECGAEPPYDRSKWLDVKHNLGMDFPNLPYMKHGETIFVESVACLTYACQLAGVHKGFSVLEEAQALSLALTVQDLRNNAVRHFYGDYDGNMEENGKTKAYVKKITDKFLKPFAKMLEGKKWLMGDKMCSADIHLCEMIYQHYLMVPEIFVGGLSTLTKDYAARFFALPKIKEYESKMDLACNNTMAAWGAEFQQCDTTFGA